MSRAEIAGSPQAAAFTAVLAEAAPGYNPDLHQWAREVTKDALRPPEWERFLLYHPHFQNSWGDVLQERAARLPQPTVSGLVSLWQHAQGVTAAIHRGKPNNLPARQLFTHNQLVQVNRSILAYNQEQAPHFLAPFIALQTAARSLRADGLDVDAGVRNACSAILNGDVEAVPGKRDKRASIFENTMATLVELYFSERDNNDNATLEPIYQRQDPFRGDTSKFVPWLNKVDGVTQGTMAVKLTRELVGLLGDDEFTTYSQLEELMSSQPLAERANDVASRHAAEATRREAKAAEYRNWQAISKRLSLNPRNATTEELAPPSKGDPDEPATRGYRTGARSGEAAGKDPFRAATLLHLKELTGGEIFFRLRGEAELRAESDSGPVNLDDTIGYLFLVTPEGHAVAEDPHKSRATLIMRAETVRGFGYDDWRQVFRGTHEEILERGVARTRHPDAEVVAQDYDGMLNKYIELILKDLTQPLETGERLRDRYKLPTISALGALAAR